jgi:hypothetical protein
MITVEKNGKTQVLRNDVQVAAFVSGGWKIVETTKSKGEKTPPKQRRGKGAKASSETQKPEQEQESGEESNG